MSYYFKTLNSNEAYDEKLQMSRKYMAFFLKLTHNLLNIGNFKKKFLIIIYTIYPVILKLI